MKRKYKEKKINDYIITNPESSQKGEFIDDIVFARYINYMRKALLNRRINYLRHKKYLLEKEISVSNEKWELLLNNDSIDNLDFNDKKSEDLKIAVEKLNEKQKKVILLYYYKNKKIKVIAQEMNM